ncbi:MAG: DUF3667 domain-containing protein [Halioglobus sp.]|nr:DUF3667 domain-containing protein [Halioglobus sp.]MCB1710548.1 DUF3667 domain-containing protein [Halioglobus sp.]MCP5121893.1 DUF3667 domain-containing protein [Pseudomonadales bacterium]MCP5192568.1 DUF3667 domain-containing protein [Pseudomonadales bacterium]
MTPACLNTTCRNCNATLTGEYCGRCGQRDGRDDLTFGELAGEVFEDFFRWDSRIWRTLLPLLFRPGFLTAEFIAGRRARYVPPFRLYLIVSFVLFLVLSLTAGDAISIRGDADLSPHPAAQGQVTGDSGSEPVIAPSAVGAARGEGTAGAHIGFSLSDEDSPRWLQDLDQRLENNAGKLQDDPDGLVQLLFDHIPQMMFLLLPVFALLLKAAYLFSPFHYLQHLVFALHFHSFAYLLYLLGALLHYWFPSLAMRLPLLLVFVLYLPLALRRAYGSPLAGATARALVILVLDAFLLLLAFAGLTLLTLALM